MRQAYDYWQNQPGTTCICAEIAHTSSKASISNVLAADSTVISLGRLGWLHAIAHS